MQFVGSTKQQPNFDCSELHASFEGMSCNNGWLAVSWHAFRPQVFKLPTIGLVPSAFVCLSDFSSILLLKLRYIFVDNTYQKHDLIFLVYGKYYNKKKMSFQKLQQSLLIHKQRTQSVQWPVSVLCIHSWHRNMSVKALNYV